MHSVTTRRWPAFTVFEQFRARLLKHFTLRPFTGSFPSICWGTLWRLICIATSKGASSRRSLAHSESGGGGSARSHNLIFTLHLQFESDHWAMSHCRFVNFVSGPGSRSNHSWFKMPDAQKGMGHGPWQCSMDAPWPWPWPWQDVRLTMLRYLVGPWRRSCNVLWSLQRLGKAFAEVGWLQTCGHLKPLDRVSCLPSRSWIYQF